MLNAVQYNKETWKQVINGIGIIDCNSLALLQCLIQLFGQHWLISLNQRIAYSIFSKERTNKRKNKRKNKLTTVILILKFVCFSLLKFHFNDSSYLILAVMKFPTCTTSPIPPLPLHYVNSILLFLSPSDLRIWYSISFFISSLSFSNEYDASSLLNKQFYDLTNTIYINLCEEITQTKFSTTVCTLFLPYLSFLALYSLLLYRNCLQSDTIIVFQNYGEMISLYHHYLHHLSHITQYH